MPLKRDDDTLKLAANALEARIKQLKPNKPKTIWDKFTARNTPYHWGSPDAAPYYSMNQVQDLLQLFMQELNSGN